MYILQFIPQISSLNPTSTLIPVLFVLIITMVKDGHDDLVSLLTILCIYLMICTIFKYY